MMRTLRIAGAIAVALTMGAWEPAEAQFNSATMGIRPRIRSFAPSRAHGTSQSGARMASSISIQEAADLIFGEVLPGPTPGTVVMSPDGVRSATGGASLGLPGSAGPARFTVDGEAGQAYSILLPETLDLLSGPNRMVLDAWTSDPGGFGLLNGSGQQTLAVGATLNVAAHQPGGTYTRVFHVTVAYE